MLKRTTPSRDFPRELAALGGEFLVWKLLNILRKEEKMRKKLVKTGIALSVGSLGFWIFKCYRRSGSMKNLLFEMGHDLRGFGRSTKSLPASIKRAYGQRRDHGRIQSNLRRLTDEVEELKSTIHSREGEAIQESETH